LEYNATLLKEINALLKKERNVPSVGALNGHLAAISCLLLIAIAGLMVTK
jgi:hypothetical protein